MNGKLYLLAWRLAPKVPEPILRGIANLAANIIWLKRGKGVIRLENNYSRIRPELSDNEIRILSRKGMHSYFRYFREAFTLPAFTPEQLAARCRVIGVENLQNALNNGNCPVLAVGHTGNWDLAGAWVAANIAPVFTVAEKLKPKEVYQAFVDFRRSIGIEALGLGDTGVFDKLVHRAQAGDRVIPLLADRDLTHRGIEVELNGHTARVAAGPATVSLAAGSPLIFTSIYYERLQGAKRKAAGTPWGIVVKFSAPIKLPNPRTVILRQGATAPQSAESSIAAEPQTTFKSAANVILRQGPLAAGVRSSGTDMPVGEAATARQSAESHKSGVQALTQAWVNQLEQFLKEHTEDWHMLQAVFVDDLDPNKYISSYLRRFFQAVSNKLIKRGRVTD